MDICKDDNPYKKIGELLRYYTEIYHLQICIKDFYGFIPGDTVAVHYPCYTYLRWCRDADHPVDVDTTVEATVEEYGTLEPVQSTVHEVACHGRVYDVVDPLRVFPALQDILCQDTFLQDTADVDLLSDEPAELLLQERRRAHEPFCASITVVVLYAGGPQTRADERLSTTYATGDGVTAVGERFLFGGAHAVSCPTSFHVFVFKRFSHCVISTR